MGDFLIEIGCEDLPDWTGGFLAQRWLPALREQMDVLRLPCADLSILCTPRRIVLLGIGVPDRQPDIETEVAGPPASVAIGPDGRFTEAAVRFARAQGADESSLRVVERGGRKAVAVTRREPGRPAPEIIGRVIPETLARVDIPRGMRWGAESMRFIRPVRWVCALWNSNPIDIVIAGVHSRPETRGHRLTAPVPVTISDIAEYVETLRKHGVLLLEEERVDRLRLLIEQALGVDERVDDADVRRTARLVEFPCLETAAIPEQFAGIPVEVTETVVRKLACIPVSGGRRFFIVTDGIEGAEVRANYGAVLAARLQDAAFFMEQDGRRRLADFAEDLDRILFHPRWGSVGDRAARLTRLATFLSHEMRLTEETAYTLQQAAHLCKNDLATMMVTEFPSLQGTIGRIYAVRDNLPDGVAVAIEEHYRPKAAGDPVPETEAGALLAILDRIDSLCCFLSDGVERVGSTDPFGLRRAAAGIVEIIWNRRMNLPLRQTVRHAISLIGCDRCVEETVMSFLRQRADNLLAAGRASAGLRRAVAAVAGEDLLALKEKVDALTEFLSQADNGDILVPFSRVANILAQAAGRGEKPGELRDSLLVEEAERDLCRRIREDGEDLRRMHADRRYAEFLSRLRRWKEPVDRFFTDVLVLCPDQELRANRLALLAAANEIFLLYADFSHITREDVAHASRTRP